MSATEAVETPDLTEWALEIEVESTWPIETVSVEWGGTIAQFTLRDYSGISGNCADLDDLPDPFRGFAIDCGAQCVTTCRSIRDELRGYCSNLDPMIFDNAYGACLTNCDPGTEASCNSICPHYLGGTYAEGVRVGI